MALLPVWRAPYNLVSIIGCPFVPTAFNPEMKPRECDEVEETRRTRDRNGRRRKSYDDGKDFPISFLFLYLVDLSRSRQEETIKRGEKRRTKLDGAKDIYFRVRPCSGERKMKRHCYRKRCRRAEIHLVDVSDWPVFLPALIHLLPKFIHAPQERFTILLFPSLYI